MNRYPNFDESLSKYRGFLEDNGYAKDVVWITPDDVLLSGRRLIYVRVPVPASNEREVRRLYERGMTEEKGVLLDTICEADGTTFSYAWVPRDQSEAELALMPVGLKMSVRTGTSRLPAKAVRSTLQWLFLRLRHHRQQRLKPGLFW